MVPEFNGGAYAPVTPNNGNPNTVYNTKPVAQGEGMFTPTAVPQFSGAANPANGNAAVPLFVNDQRRSPLSITLERPAMPRPVIPQSNMYGASLGRIASRLQSLQSNLQPIPIPGLTPPATPPDNGPVQPDPPSTQPVVPNTPQLGGAGTQPGNGVVPLIRENVWGPSGVSFDQNMIPVRPTGGEYGFQDGLGNTPSFDWNRPVGGNSGGSSGNGGIGESLGDLFNRGMEYLRNDWNNTFGSNAGQSQGWNILGAALDAFMPGSSTVLDFVRERATWGENGRPDIDIEGISRIPDQTLRARALLEAANRELGNAAAEAIQQQAMGQAMSASNQRAVELLRQQAMAAGFPAQIENMSPQEIRNLSNRITVAQMVSDPNSRQIGNTGYRSIAGGAGPRGMIERLRGATGANGRIGLMSPELQMELEADAQFQEYVRNQER